VIIISGDMGHIGNVKYYTIVSIGRPNTKKDPLWFTDR